MARLNEDVRLDMSKYFLVAKVGLARHVLRHRPPFNHQSHDPVDVSGLTAALTYLQVLMPLPLHILNELAKIEPAADFTGAVGGRVQSSNGKVYFVKQGSRSEGEQYIGETESLKEIDLASPGLAPKVFSAGDFEDGTPFFISEYKDIGHLDDKSATVLAKRLATELHVYTSPNGFGFKVPTFCGATRMKNGWFNSWEECYSEMIGDLLETLRKRGGHEGLCAKGETIRKQWV